MAKQSLTSTFISRGDVLRAMRAVPGFGVIEPRLLSHIQKRNLQRLNDVLARTPLDGHYWLFSGVLLGWAREGRLLIHDYDDADFAYDANDDDRFAASVPDLVRAGFEPLHRFRSNDGEFTEHSFQLDLAKFEFFRFTRHESCYQYHVYGWDPHDRTRFVEMTAQIAAQRRERIKFLGRTWLKPADHEAELTAIYGEWRTPDQSWSYLNDNAIVERRTSIYPDFIWH